ncbi:lamin tail domain-containing protein, partial [Candidatus Dojkabacteria bacterium]|nr:lamin tail domain-containing protein [Candidatus Dojkabacteria bacterium]
IALNEILPNPAGSDSGNEWIELYNCTDEDFSLDGWYLEDKSENKHDLSEEIIISKGFLLIYPNFSINQSDEGIYLYNSDSILIDEYTYSSSKEDVSFSRMKDGVGEWTDILQPTPGEPNYIEFPQDIRINEVFPAPDDSLNEIEWIEIYNFSDSQIDLTNWTLMDESEIVQRLENINVEAGDFFIIDQNNLSISLNNGGDIITLKNPNQEIVSEFEYIQTPIGLSNIFYEDIILQTKAPTPNNENIYISPSDCFYGLDEIDIRNFKSLKPESDYIITGIVAAGIDQIYPQRFYIQDENNGLLVKLPEEFQPEEFGLEVGAKLKICGNYGSYYGESQITLTSENCLQNVGQGDVNIKNLDNLSQVGIYTGQLIKVKGQIISNSGKTFTISDTKGTLKINLPSSINSIEKTKGDIAIVTGILTQYGTDAEGAPNLRLIPRGLQDINIIQQIIKTSSDSTNTITKSLLTENSLMTPIPLDIDISLNHPQKTNFTGNRELIKQGIRTKQRSNKMILSIQAGGFLTSISSIISLLKKKGV